MYKLDEHASFLFNVALPTKINISPNSSVSACPKDSPTLTCTSDEPVFYIAWFYNGSPIYGKNLISMTTDMMDGRVSANSTSTSLTIPSVMNEDAGGYICAFSCRTAALDLTQIPQDLREQVTVTVKGADNCYCYICMYVCICIRTYVCILIFTTD